MRRFVITIFDEWVYGSAMYTSDVFEELLASVEQFSIQAIADAVSGGGTITLTVGCESSSDARTWTVHPDLISAATIDVETTNVKVGWFPSGGALMAQGLIRLKIALGGATPKARVRLMVCGRDTAKGRDRTAAMTELGPAPAIAAGVNGAALQPGASRQAGMPAGAARPMAPSPPPSSALAPPSAMRASPPSAAPRRPPQLG
jgi:hypothetical protein